MLVSKKPFRYLPTYEGKPTESTCGKAYKQKILETAECTLDEFLTPKSNNDARDSRVCNAIRF